jgi:DNA-binding CsgD family transcriptional regulator
MRNTETDGFGGLRTRRFVCACAGFAQVLLVHVLLTWGMVPWGSLWEIDIIAFLRVWTTPHFLAFAAVFICYGVLGSSIGRQAFRALVLLGGVLLLGGYAAMVIFGADPAFGEASLCLSAVAMGLGLAIFFMLGFSLLRGFSNEEIPIVLLVTLMSFALGSLVLSLLPDQALLAAPAVLTLTMTGTTVWATTKRFAMSPSGSGFSSGLSSGSGAGSDSSPGSGPDCSDASRRGGQPQRVWQQLSLIRDPLFCVASLAFAVSITRFIAINDLPGSDANAINVTQALGIGLLAVALFLVKYGPGRRVELLRDLNIPSLYRISFPVVATALLLFSVLGNQLAVAVCTLVFALYYVVWVLIISTCRDMARTEAIDSTLMYGLCGAIINLVFAAATTLGTVLYGEAFFGAATLSVCVLLVLYVLTMANSSVQNRRLRKGQKGADGSATAGKAAGADNSEGAEEGRGLSSLEAICQQIANEYRLTARENDILLLLAGGRDVPYIAKHFVISKNTVRTHSKSLYVKLGIHNRQDLLDFLESYPAPSFGS